MKIAIVEDDEQIAQLVKLILQEINEDIIIFNNGWKAIDEITKEKFELIILDIMLPGANGYEVCRKIRDKGIETPILMLTSKSDIDDKVHGLELGADDYLTKPFSNKELLARVKALLRRVDNTETKKLKNDSAIKIGNLTINPKTRSFIKEGAEIELTSKEFDLMYLFMSNAGRSFTRIELLERVWGDNFDGLEHTVNSNINRIRTKIEDNPNKPEYLLTVWGVGYKFSKK
jgi:DNA-binding response OmpR family regulator